MGYTIPTPIQERAIPIGLAGRDLIGTANTGTGKTVAFVLPLLQQLLTQPARGQRARALILTPTRELADQIQEAIRGLSQFTSLRSTTIYGGVSMGPQERALRTGVEILVACPGRLLDHLQQGTASLDQIEALVIDEADRMLDMGFLPAVKRILAKLPKDRHTQLFSATFPAELEQMGRTTLRDPARVDAGTGVAAHTVAHALFPVPPHLKTALLIDLLAQTGDGSVLIFTRTKHRANRLAQQLQRAGRVAGVLHANRSQNQRKAALDGFRSGEFQLLVATDIAARGLDIATVSHVINYDIPDTADTYIHRIGRTGRAEREGDALTLVTHEDDQMVREIERALKAPIERRRLPGFAYDQTAAAAGSVSLDARPGNDSRGQGGQRSRRPSDGGGSQRHDRDRSERPRLDSSRSGISDRSGRDVSSVSRRPSSGATQGRTSPPVGNASSSAPRVTAVASEPFSSRPATTPSNAPTAPRAVASRTAPPARVHPIAEPSGHTSRPVSSAPKGTSSSASSDSLSRLWPHLVNPTG